MSGRASKLLLGSSFRAALVGALYCDFVCLHMVKRLAEETFSGMTYELYTRSKFCRAAQHGAATSANNYLLGRCFSPEVAVPP